MYYSQIGQDEYFIKNISKRKRNGIYLDIGANDGRHGSNTATLEYEYGWTGLCIEPNPKLVQKLAESRPNSTIIHKAVWTFPGKVNIEVPLSFKGSEPPDQLGRITGIERNEASFKKFFDKGYETFTVESDTVTNIVKETLGLPITIDYMSLDTEGAEMEALESIDFSRIDIKFMTIEHGNRKGYKKMFEQYLKQFGYRVHRVNQWDIEFER